MKIEGHRLPDDAWCEPRHFKPRTMRRRRVKTYEEVQRIARELRARIQREWDLILATHVDRRTRREVRRTEINYGHFLLDYKAYQAFVRAEEEKLFQDFWND